MSFLGVSDNIDTRSSLDALRECITSCNIYCRDSGSKLNVTLLHQIALYITKMMKIFGTITSDNQIGFPLASNSTCNPSNVSIIFFVFFSHSLITYVLSFIK